MPVPLEATAEDRARDLLFRAQLRRHLLLPCAISVPPYAVSVPPYAISVPPYAVSVPCHTLSQYRSSHAPRVGR
eukprot:3891948-Rhodomonas_salina.1